MPFPYHPWDERYICLLIFHKKQRNAGKYTQLSHGWSGIVFSYQHVGRSEVMFFFQGTHAISFKEPSHEEFSLHTEACTKKNRTGSYSIEYTQTNVQTHFCWKRISLCLYFVLLSNSQTKTKDQGEFCQQEISALHILNPKGHHMAIPGHITFTPPSRVT